MVTRLIPPWHNPNTALSAQLFSGQAFSCDPDLPKIATAAKTWQKLLKVAKTWQKLPKHGKSCLKNYKMLAKDTKSSQKCQNWPKILKNSYEKPKGCKICQKMAKVAAKKAKKRDKFKKDAK